MHDVAAVATPVAGDFECSSPLVNQLQSNIVWGQRGNYLEVPTDCPQRDERLGGGLQGFADVNFLWSGGAGDGAAAL